MLNRTCRKGAIVILVAGLLAGSAACGPTSGAQTAQKTTGMSTGPTTLRPVQQLRRASRGTSSGTLSVVAGLRVFNLAPGPATRVSLLDPKDVAVDNHGDLFIADSYNNVVEEVTPAGRLSVVAGDLKQGSPTPGPATSSNLSYPTGVAVDKHGDLYIADQGNNVVEEVSPAGRLSVVAGSGKQGPPTPGPATDSELNFPYGVAVDAQGDLFIADSVNNVVEEVTPAGRLSVVAGTGKGGLPTPGPADSSALAGPEGVAVDAHGDLFIADFLNNVVEKVTPAGRLSVVAGNGARRPGAPGPATGSELERPSGVAVDSHGDLFIADLADNVVEKVTPAGRLSVVAGDGKLGLATPGPAISSDLSYPTGVAVDAHGDLFISDEGFSVVEEVNPAGRLSVVAGIADQSGRPTPGPATRSDLGNVHGVAVDAVGNLFIADGSGVVEKVNPAGRLSVVAGDFRAGQPTPGPATRSGLGPSGVAVDAHGDLFIADSSNNVVEEVNPAGRLSVVAGDGRRGPPTPGPADTSRLDDPLSVAVDAQGDLFIADQGNNVVEEVTPAGRLSVVAGDGKRGPPTPGPADSSRLDGPWSVAVDAQGGLFIADTGNNVVEEVTPAGRLSVVAGDGKRGPPTPGPADSSELDGPTGVTADAHGDLFIADQGNNVVEEVTPAGRLSVVAGDGEEGPPTPGPADSSRLLAPADVAVGAHGDLFIADQGNGDVEKVTF